MLLCLLPPEAWSVGDQYRLYVSPTEEEMIVDRSAQWDGISVEVRLLQVEEDYLIEECGAPIRPYEGGGEHQNGPVPPQRSVGWEEVYTEPGNQRTWRRRREANKP